MRFARHHETAADGPSPSPDRAPEDRIPVVRGSFVVLGDLQPTSRLEAWRESNRPEREAIVREVARSRPDFAALLGDLVFCGSSRAAWSDFDALWAPMSDAGVPTLPVLGNHEYWVSRRGGLANFFARFPALDGRRWHAAVYGPVGLVFLDSNRRFLRAAVWREQIGWFARQLERFDAAADVRGVVVLLHHPPFTNSTLTSDELHVQREILPAFRESAKTLAMIAGHVHSYERFEREGKHYVVAGGGGGPRVRLSEGVRRRHLDDAFAGPALRSFHFLRFTPTADGLEAEVVGLEKGASAFAPMDRFRLEWAS